MPTTASEGAPTAMTPEIHAGEDQLHVKVVDVSAPVASTNTATKPPPNAAIAGGLATLVGSDETTQDPRRSSVAPKASVDAPETAPPTTATAPLHASASASRIGTVTSLASAAGSFAS